MGQGHSSHHGQGHSLHQEIIEKQIKSIESHASTSPFYHVLVESAAVRGWPTLVTELLNDNNDNQVKKTFFTLHPNKSPSDYISLILLESLSFYHPKVKETDLDLSLVHYLLDAGHTTLYPLVKSFLFHSLFLKQRSISWPLTTDSRLLNVSSVFLFHLTLDTEKFNNKAWTRLFSTAAHGKSWTVFTNAIKEAQASLIVMRDKKGHVFGGFASQPWECHPSFFGDDKSFLFSLQPQFQLYFPSGLNKNYQYYCTGTKTLANGLGFGGQMDYFALWIQDDFEHGSCRSEPLSTTFSNPLLASSPTFEIDSVEVWSVQELQVDDRLIDKHKSSVLDQIGEAGFLEMAGKTMYSKDIPREPVDR